MRDKGFTLVEVIVVVFIVGLLAAIAVRVIRPTEEAKVIACFANIEAHISMTEQLREQSYPFVPDQQQMYDWMGNRRNKHYTYIANSSDTNNGHGNDLDLCDEENPGSSLENRDCLDIKYVWVCDHYHGDLAKYLFGTDSTGPLVVPIKAILKSNKKNIVTGAELVQTGNGDEFLRDLNYWTVTDPNFQKWIGR